MITVISTLFVLSVMVFIHELGHFLGAKIFGIRVDRFSMGYPPRLIGKKIGDTDYCISLIPFGGYVKIAGMVDESMDTKQLKAKPQPWEYRSRPWIQRFLVILAGPFMNLVLGTLIFIAIYWFHGVARPVPPVVGRIMEGKPAAEAGILPGDRIVSVDEKKIDTWFDLREILQVSPNKTLTMAWTRGDSLMQSRITPNGVKVAVMGDSILVGEIGVGVADTVLVQPAGFLGGITAGISDACEMSKLIVVLVYNLISGKESLRSLAGPVGIAKMAGDSARSGLGPFVFFIAILSLNLGVLNLVPLPVFDGGHLVYLFIEGIIRREIPVKVKLIIQQIGMVFILGLMGYIVYNDIIRFVIK